MSWEKVNVGEVELGPKPVAPGTYTLALLGAYESKYRPGQTDVCFMVTDDGPEKGKKIYLEIPNPDELDWAIEVYARLVKALGADVTPYASPLVELPKIAQNGHSRVTADVFIKEFPKKDGSTGQKSTINSRSLRPAA